MNAREDGMALAQNDIKPFTDPNSFNEILFLNNIGSIRAVLIFLFYQVVSEPSSELCQ